MSKSCLKSSSTCIEANALARSSVHAGSSEPSPHADVIRTRPIYSINFSLQTIILFSNSV